MDDIFCLRCGQTTEAGPVAKCKCCGSFAVRFVNKQEVKIESPRISLSHVRTDPSRSAQDARCFGRVCVGADA